VNKRNPHPLKNCLDNFKKSYGDLDKLSKINENWKNLIGLELFQECKPLNIEKKILTIAVNHPQWRQALIYNKHKLKERIEKIGITLNEIKIIQNYEIKNKNIQNSNNEWGTGGISTKLISAEIATKGGVEVQLVDGTNNKNLIEIFNDNKIGTLFYPVEKPIGNKKSWLSHAIQTVGKITLDDGASFAIKKKGASLLAVGVKNVEGNFTINQAVKIVNTNDKEVAKGLVSISSDKLRSILNNKENNNSSIIVVHRDVLALS